MINLTMYVIYVLLCLVVVGMVGGITKVASHGIHILEEDGYVMFAVMMKILVGIMNVSLTFYAYETIFRHLLMEFL